MGCLYRLRATLSLFFFLFAASLCALAAPGNTQVMLTAASGGTPISGGGTISRGSSVTLTAAVSAGTTKVTQGQVSFCEASVPSCTDIHLVGTAALTKNGTAVLSFTPGIGSHSYRAVFLGTPNASTPYAGGASSNLALVVSGPSATTTGILESPYGTPGEGRFTLNARVGSAGPAPATGTISVLNASDSNAILGTAALQAGAGGVSFIDSEKLNTSAVVPDFYPLVAAGDFNGDGKLDFVVVNSSGCNTTPCWNAGATAFLGDGAGAFTHAATLDLGGPNNTPFDSLVAADFNGDGIVDLAVGSSGAKSITILLGNGDGTFKNPGIEIAGIAGQLVAGDLNGDGITDLAVLDTTTGVVSILPGKGDGGFTFSTAAPPVAGASPQMMVSGDFNGDGIADLVVDGSDNTITVLLGNGDGTFTAAPAIDVTTGSGSTIVAADFNQDGKLDLAVENSPAGTLTILQGQGDGTFKQGTVISVVSGGSTAITAPMVDGDFNGDGKTDLIVSGGKMLLGKGDGSFTSQNISIWPDPGSVTVVAGGDFNADGATDAVINWPETQVFFAAPQSAMASANITLPLSSGLDEVFASYGGDSGNAASTSGALQLQSGQGAATVTVTASPNPASVGSSVTLTAKVGGGSVGATGNVTFYDGSAPLGTVALSSGTATYATNSLVLGTHAITASYGGDSNYQATNSAPVSVVVNSAPAITAPAPPAVSAGGTAKTTVTVSAGSAYAGTMNLTCALSTSPTGAQSLPTCSLSPSSVAVTAGASAATTLSVATTAASTSAMAKPSAKGWPWGAGGTVLCIVFLWGIAKQRRDWMRLAGLLCLGACLGLTGCGSGSSKGTSIPGTTPGKYTFTITGTDSVHSATTVSTTVVVTVT